MAQGYELSHGAAAGKLAELYGMAPLGWQEEVLEDWGAINGEGKFVHTTCGLSVPRQNGKSIDGIIWAVYLCLKMGAVVVWTDHNYSTTSEMHRRFRRIFGKRMNDPDAEYPAFNAMLSGVSSKTAQEAFFFRNGGELHFSTRTNSSALGFSFDVIFYDEAQELTSEHVQAIGPTATSGKLHNSQEIYLGSPVRAGSKADVFGRVRETAADSSDACWCEYGVDEVGDPADESRWYAANPSLGTIAGDRMIRVHSQLWDPLIFAQEHLGYWCPKLGAGVTYLVEKRDWDALAIPPSRAPEDGKTAYGVKFSTDGGSAAISAAILEPNGSAYVELIDIVSTARGCNGLAWWIAERREEWSECRIDGKRGSDTLMRKLIENGCAKNGVKVASTADVIAATTSFLSDIGAGQVTHISEPALDGSVCGSIERKIGTGGGIGFGDGPEVSSIAAESAALALFAARTSKRDPRRKAVARW